ncbi:parasitic stage specific protein 1 [Aphelenchoides avenae]|nr:parasitic stage specific protein 1 [Aphelenchus avenae]
MLRTIVFFASCCACSLGACVDKKTNVVTAADVGNYPIQLGQGVGGTYDGSNQPSCYKDTPDIKSPGALRAISGYAVVTKAYNLLNNAKAYLTLEKNSWFIGTVCKDGVSQNPLVPDSDCQLTVCSSSNAIENGLCKALSTVGKHDLGQLEGASGLNGTIPVPKIPGALKPLIRGQWKVEVQIKVGDEVVLHVKAPANEEWLYIME